MKLFIARIFAKIGIRGLLKVAGGVAVAALVGWLWWQWTSGQAAKEEVRELREEIQAIERQFEQIETLQERLEENRQQDIETREIIRRVPDNRLTEEDKDAIRSIFP